MGGGFGVGIHNVLEAAVYGIPVFLVLTMQSSRRRKALNSAVAALRLQTHLLSAKKWMPLPRIRKARMLQARQPGHPCRETQARRKGFLTNWVSDFGLNYVNDVAEFFVFSIFASETRK